MRTTPPALFRLGRIFRACPPSCRGVVSLVGAGPGDPGLLTVKAARRLSEADVVYHDALVSEPILGLCRPGISLVPVGKRRGRVTLPQEEIVEALARDARRGLVVVRLKGGDPFVFGRGGEEALGLLERGIAFEIVSGVSSGVAVPAAAGIPVTHRGVSGSVAFVTAHDLSAESLRLRLAHLARGSETLVIFMAGTELHAVRDVLLAVGLPAATEAAVIENGTLPSQRVATGILGELPSILPDPTGGPVLLVIGRVVALGDRLRTARRPHRVAAHA